MESPLPVRLAFLAALLFCLSPWATPPVALALGVALALTLGNPFPRPTAKGAKSLLKLSVVGLGFGISLGEVVAAGSNGVLYTILGIAFALLAGWLLGLWLRVDRETSMLITTGTSICGGSAIAAVGSAIRAREESMTVALGTVFVLNGVALYLFPVVGRALDLSQGQFAVWAAVAIHDTSSVVGAAATYGQEALDQATVLKLARALWIVPLTLAASVLSGSRSTGAEQSGRAPIPWFIGAFLLAAVIRSATSPSIHLWLDGIAGLARTGLVITLFLIGAGLSRAALARVGARPLVQGTLLWIVVASAALWVVAVWV